MALKHEKNNELSKRILKVTGLQHDTHKSGLCKSGKHSAKVVGEVKGNEFIATKFEVLSNKKEDAHSDHDHGDHKH